MGADTQLIHQIKWSLPVQLFEGVKEMKILLEPCETQAGSLAASRCKLRLQLIQAPPHLDILLGR